MMSTRPSSRSVRVRVAAAAFPCVVLAAFGGALALAIWRYLAEYAESEWVAAAVGIASVAAALVLGRVLVRRRGPGPSVAAAALSLVAIVAVPASVALGRVTWARFGLTIYGAVPVPFFDVTIDADGRPWLRNKTHRITLEEVLPLVDDATETVFVGIGWDSVAQVDDAVREALGPRLRVLSTGAAFDAYNAARAEGRRVALLAHTTC